MQKRIDKGKGWCYTCAIPSGGGGMTMKMEDE